MIIVLLRQPWMRDMARRCRHEYKIDMSLGTIALEAAAENGNFDVVDRLLTAKTDVNAEAELKGQIAL